MSSVVEVVENDVTFRYQMLSLGRTTPQVPEDKQLDQDRS